MINGTLFGVSVADKTLVVITSSLLFGFVSVGATTDVVDFSSFNSLFLLF